MVFGKRLLAMLRILLATDPAVWEDASAQAGLKERLIEKGFLSEEVDAVFEWFAVPALRQEVLSHFDPLFLARGLPDDMDPSVTSISPKAMTFLQVLRELDLIDDAIEEDIMNRLVLTADKEVTLEDMKHVAGTVMFERQFGSNDDYSLYDEEWRLLFN